MLLSQVGCKNKKNPGKWTKIIDDSSWTVHILELKENVCITTCY